MPAAPWRAACAALLALWTGLAAAEAPTLEEIRALAEGGAGDLALRLMDQTQPALEQAPEDWMAWERERVRIHHERRDWAGLAARLEALPEDLPQRFQAWARSQQAEAYLALGRGRAAREVLRRLIWTGTATARDPEQLPRWRRLIIRSYLVEGRPEDAHTALQRFEVDYGLKDMDDLFLHARVLLTAGRAEEAAVLLAPHLSEPRAAVLHLLAQLRSGNRQARRVLQSALRQLDADWLPAALRGSVWAVVAEAAGRIGDRPTEAHALEQVLLAQAQHPLPEGLFAIDGDRLWQAYRDYALLLGNQAQFLVGDDERWFQAAEEAGRRYPVRARSLSAFVLLQGRTADSREQAAAVLMRNLPADPAQAERLLRILFLASSRFPDPAALPVSVRHHLVDLALRGGDMAMASTLMATMNTPPEGVDAFMWQLRRARILVMGDRPQEGAAVLEQLLAGEALSGAQLDRLLQVVFDLQTVQAHDAAVRLFEQVLPRRKDPQLQREILYWMADSRKAQGRYDEAARLYLKSAALPGPGTMDPWAQTAHYQAAESLAKAGLVRDARTLYSALLDVTQDPARRAVLRHELERLWLAGGEDEVTRTEGSDED